MRENTHERNSERTLMREVEGEDVTGVPLADVKPRIRVAARGRPDRGPGPLVQEPGRGEPSRAL
jgi:hypothetical protein